MKNNILILLLIPLISVIISCEKEQEKQEDLFEKPITDWSLTKDGVQSIETRNLIEETSSDEIVVLLNYSEKGDGSLKYSDPNPIIEWVDYGFYCEQKTLVTSIYSFVNNSEVYQQVFDFLKKKYGNLYDEMVSNDGNTIYYTWEISNMVIEYKKSNYTHVLDYRKPGAQILD